MPSGDTWIVTAIKINLLLGQETDSLVNFLSLEYLQVRHYYATTIVSLIFGANC
jgi:hypothetical protein